MIQTRIKNAPNAIKHANLIRPEKVFSRTQYQYIYRQLFYASKARLSSIADDILIQSA